MTMPEDPTTQGYARLRSQVQALETDNSALRLALSTARSEVTIYKRRCYPTVADVAGVTVAQVESWLATKFTRDASVHGGRPWWEGTLGATIRTDWDRAGEIGRVIEWSSDTLGLDQWEVLAEMRAMPEQDSAVAP